MEASYKEAKGYSLLPGIDSLYFFISCETELYHNFYKLVDSGDYQKFENYSFQYKIPRIIVFLLQKIEKWWTTDIYFHINDFYVVNDL